MIARLKIRLARRRAGIPVKVAPTGRVIDMVPSRWGWSLNKWAYDEATDTVRTGGWCHPRPFVGDELIVQEGAPRVVVLKVEYARDPDDMWYANVGIVE